MATFDHIKFGDNLTVTDETGGVIRVDAGPGATSTPPDATTTTKGIVQLAGDLTGTAASPQIAALAITDAEVAAANKDGAAATPSLRTLGTGANQAAPGNDSRFPAAAVSYGTSLPASPVNGQIAILVDTVAAAWQWAFRYNSSATTYKWEFIGGPPLVYEDASTVSNAAATTWYPVGPSFAVPRPGMYLIGFGQQIITTAAAQVYIGVADHASPTTPIAYVPIAVFAPANDSAASVSRQITITGVVQIDSMIYSNVAGTQFTNRWVSLIPRRVS